MYLCQQSAEKGLKSFLYLHHEDQIFTHSIAVLLHYASEIDEAFEVVADAKRLDDYYIPTRYPNGLPGEIPARYFDDHEEAEEALAWSEQVVALVAERVERNVKGSGEDEEPGASGRGDEAPASREPTAPGE